MKRRKRHRQKKRNGMDAASNRPLAPPRKRAGDCHQQPFDNLSRTSPGSPSMRCAVQPRCASSAYKGSGSRSWWTITGVASRTVSTSLTIATNGAGGASPRTSMWMPSVSRHCSPAVRAGPRSASCAIDASTLLSMRGLGTSRTPLYQLVMENMENMEGWTAPRGHAAVDLPDGKHGVHGLITACGAIPGACDATICR